MPMPSRNQSSSTASTAVRVVVMILVVTCLAGLGYAFFAMYRMFTADRDRAGEIPVPNVVKLSQADAVELLESKGLKAEIKTGVNDQIASGLVYQQNPKATMHRRPGSSVVIWVSQGKSRYVVPQLIGKNVDQASRELIEHGFILGVFKKVYDTSVSPGQVVSQQPVAGQEFISVPTVDLLIADNQQVDVGPMPNLTGQTLADAERLLARSGLQLTKVTHVSSDIAATGTVLKQNVAADSPAKIGQKVELEVAMAVSDVQRQNKRLQVQIVIPEGPQQQQVRVKVIDSLGENVVCDESKAPQDTVTRAIDVEGPARIIIYIRDMKTPWREDVIPYQAPPAWTPPSDDDGSPPGAGQ
jgi:serine/threonine-protein kinase